MCAFVNREKFGRKRTTSDFYFLKKDSSWSVCIFTSPLSDQIVHSFVVVQDGTAIISVVLQIAAVSPTATRAGGLQFFSGTRPITSLLYIFRLTDMAERLSSKSPPWWWKLAGE